METSGENFEVNLGMGTNLLVRPEQTTDGVPVYHCYTDDTVISQLRQEPSGEWIQVWGELPRDIVQQLGERITDHMG